MKPGFDLFSESGQAELSETVLEPGDEELEGAVDVTGAIIGNGTSQQRCVRPVDHTS